jgi:hypothetical protein
VSHRLRIVCDNHSGGMLTHEEVVFMLGKGMASLGFVSSGYIVHHGPLSTFFLHDEPDDETPTKVLLHYAQNPATGFTMHVYHEPAGGGSQKILVIPPA